MENKAEILNYVKERYIEEQARFNHFENKSFKLVKSLTIVIAAFGSIVSFKSEVLLSPGTEIQRIILFLCCVAFLALFCAWGHSMRALRIGKCPIAAKNRENAEYLLNAPPEDAFKQMYDCYVDATQKLDSIIDFKSINLEHAYNELILGTSTVVVIIFLTLILEVLK
jgi:hypothetical protein